MRLNAPLYLFMLLTMAGCAQREATRPASSSGESASAASEASSSAAPDQGDRPAAATAANPILGQGLLTADQVGQGWISLFDGASLFGWKSNQEGINWRVEDGAITADEGPIGLLLTSVPFADFELVCEYRMSAGGNSGVFLRTLAEPKNVQQDCYEVNIADAHPEGFLTGSLVGRAKPAAALPGSGDWQTLRVVAQGNHFQIDVNGAQVLDYQDDSPAARRQGLIGLQKNEGKIAFRKVNLKPLGLKSLFDGKDLAGWREVPGSKSRFSIEDGTIHVVNGQGFLETEQTFQDFIFQAQAKTNARDLNSGYFFRAMPGTEKAPSNGYELQIHNGFKDGDRNQPDNAGTGAIFRRVEARRVVSDDLSWFTSTLIASGPRIAVWVDGYQVVDWEDTRAPDENPRKGKRLEGGHISLQGHDPTTDVQFRQLFIAEYPQNSSERIP